MSASDTAPNNSIDVSRLTRIQKLAILLVMLGPESAAQVLRHLDEHELESVSAEMSRQTLIPQEVQTEILKEFSEVAVQATTCLRGGVEYTQAALEKAVGAFKTSTVMSRIAPSRTPALAMQDLADLEPRQIFNLLKQEQPQTTALFLSYLSPEKGSAVLSFFRGILREQIVEKLATLTATPVDVMEKILNVLNQKLRVKQHRAVNHTGGVKSAADLLNALDKETTKEILLTLGTKNPELTAQIKQKMFTFEDLANLELSALQKIMREIDIKDLGIALKTASEQLKNLLLGAISKRAAETVLEEMSFMGSVKLKEIEAAQLRIIDMVRRLEMEGEIDLGELKEDENVLAA